ncbi:MAG: hypothetical protein ACE5JD_07345, partial [Candidatus Methylomirabilia bacterium]
LWIGVVHPLCQREKTFDARSLFGSELSALETWGQLTANFAGDPNQLRRLNGMGQHQPLLEPRGCVVRAWSSSLAIRGVRHVKRCHLLDLQFLPPRRVAGFIGDAFFEI